MAEKHCVECERPTQIRHLGKINGRLLYKKCRSHVRKDHREETKKQRREMMELSRKAKEGYDKAHTKRERKKADVSPPKIKGSKPAKTKKKSESYLTLQDKQVLFRILVQRGVEAEDAKERIRNLIISQKEIRKRMQAKDKPEEQIKKRQKKLLEALWSY